MLGELQNQKLNLQENINPMLSIIEILNAHIQIDQKKD